MLDSVGDSLALTSIFAALPLLTRFVLLGVLRMRAWMAALISLAVSVVVAVVFYPMPVVQTLAAGTEGAAFRVLPDPVDRDQRDLGLQHDRGDRTLRRAAPVRQQDQPTSGSRASAWRSRSVRCSRRLPASAPPSRSPASCWLGAAVTGSDTSSNSLFGALQVTAANQAGLDPLLMAASNSSGGVLGKMISPQNLAIACAAVGLSGREGDLFRKVIGWSVGFLVFMCLLVYLQSTPVLRWMVP